MKNKTASLFLSDPNFNSKEFFKRFLERRSWEPGWFGDFRKDKWENFIQLSDQGFKDERWRFSSRNRLDYSKVEKVLESNLSVSGKDSEQKGLILGALDKMI